MFNTTELNEDLQNYVFDELSKLYENSATYENKRFAIRSSAIGEDSEDLSSAGQNETILGPILDGEKTESIFLVLSILDQAHLHLSRYLPGPKESKN